MHKEQYKKHEGNNTKINNTIYKVNLHLTIEELQKFKNDQKQEILKLKNYIINISEQSYYQLALLNDLALLNEGIPRGQLLSSVRKFPNKDDSLHPRELFIKQLINVVDIHPVS